MQTNIKLRRGDSRTITIAVVDSAGDPYDLTGLTVWFTAKTKYSLADASAEIKKTIADGISVASNVATISIDPDDTNSLPDRDNFLQYDFQIKDGSGGIYTVAAGKMVIEPDVTKAIT